jgi:hypothetical protein
MTKQTFIEVECTKDMPYRRKSGSQYVAGKLYVATQKKSGGYEIDTELGNNVVVTQEQFNEYFREVK